MCQVLITSFGTLTGDIYGITITALPLNSNSSFLIDNVLLQEGLNTPNQTNDTFLGLADTFNDYFTRGFQILRVNKSGTGIESVELQDIVSDVALSGDYADLINTPQNTSNFVNDGSGGGYPYVTEEQLLLSFTFEQSTPSMSWVVNHPLNRMPATSIVDSSGSLVFGKVTYVNLSTLIIDFNSPFSGYVYLT